MKDSVVGEERIVQYLLAVLNTRGTPLHWKNSNSRRMERIQNETAEKVEYSLKNLRTRRKPANNSGVLYIEVTKNSFIFHIYSCVFKTHYFEMYLKLSTVLMLLELVTNY